MTRKRDKLIAFECDGCGEVLTTDTRLLKDAVKELKANRWRFHNNTPTGKFKHYCKKCK